MKIIKIISFALFFSSLFTHANIKTTVTGKVLEKKTNSPLGYATVSFIEIGQFSTKFGGITNENGEFSIDVDTGTYTIKVEFIGFKSVLLENQKIEKNLDLGIIHLSEDAQSLSEVVVTGEKKTVRN